MKATRQYGRMGGEFLVGLNREVRDGAGVAAGDEVDVVPEPDTRRARSRCRPPWVEMIKAAKTRS